MFARSRQSGFSLIELVIVVVIIGIIGAIAIPRMSRAAEGAGENALRQNLQTMRRALELYREEHLGLNPDTDATFEAQLTLYTDVDGNINAVRTSVFRFGPYLRSVPPLPVGENRGSVTLRDGGSPGDGDEGWWYDKDVGEIWANTKDAELDSRGVAYNTY